MFKFKKSRTVFVIIMLSVIVLLNGCSAGGGVENTENYSFDASNKTLTIHSDGYFDSDYEKFKGLDSSYVFENVVIDDGVTKIGESVFSSCENLKNITIPNSVKEIGFGAFNNCKNLESLKIPDGVTEINGFTFWGCKNLTSVTIPNSVTEIGISAFHKCKNIKNITIPNSVIKICDGVREIGDEKVLESAFYGWTEDQTIYVQGRSTAPDTWGKDWTHGCKAKIVWNA